MDTEGCPSCSRQDPPPLCRPAPRPAHPPRGSAPGPTAENRKSIRKGNTGGGPACTQRQGPASSCARCRQPHAPHRHQPRRSPDHPAQPFLQTPTLPGLDREGGAPRSIFGVQMCCTDPRTPCSTQLCTGEQGMRGVSRPAAALRSSVRAGDRQGTASAPWQLLHRLFQMVFNPGDSPRSAGRVRQ